MRHFAKPRKAAVFRAQADLVSELFRVVGNELPKLKS